MDLRQSRDVRPANRSEPCRSLPLPSLIYPVVMLTSITRRFALRSFATEAAKPVVAAAAPAVTTSYAEINAMFMRRLKEARTKSEIGGGVERVAKQVRAVNQRQPAASLLRCALCVSSERLAQSLLTWWGRGCYHWRHGVAVCGVVPRRVTPPAGVVQHGRPNPKCGFSAAALSGRARCRHAALRRRFLASLRHSVLYVTAR